MMAGPFSGRSPMMTSIIFILRSTMSIFSAHCSRAFSTVSRPSIRASQTNGATIDRYSVIRNFFRNQTTLLPTFPPQKSTALFTWKHQLQTRQRVAIVQQSLSSRLFTSNTGCPGFVRRIHTNTASMNMNKPRDEPKPPDPEPQARQTSSNDSEEPATSNDTSEIPCTCRGSSNNSQKPTSSPTPLQSHSLHQPHKQRFDPSHPPKHLEGYSRFFRRLAMSLPHPHRPTRDEFLSVATGFWQRLNIRFKWFTIKSFRKFNADDISAFVTWFLMSQTLWIFVGT